MINRAELKSRGLQAFKNNYWLCVVVSLIMGFVSGSSSGGSSSNFNRLNSNSSGSSYSDYSDLFHGDTGMSNEQITAFAGIFIVVLLVAILIGVAFSVFVSNPLLVGCKRYFAINAFEKPNFNEVAFSFKKGQYMNIVKVMFMKNLFIFLWSLLFIIPGIIKSYEYYLVDYIISEDPTLDYKEALEQSKQMMNGNKMDTFVLHFSFIGWIILGVLTCGILLIFYVNPYMAATDAELFLDLRGKHFGPGVPPYHQLSFAGGFGGQPGGFNPQAGGYNQPGGYNAPSSNFGQTSNYGQPYTPNQPGAYGVSQDPYGQAPQNSYGQPYTPNQPTDPYGQPSAPQDPYGQAPQDPYGQAPQNSNPDAYYGQEPTTNNDKPFGLD